jgi:LCP family protein required for cell wall assembly
MLASFDPETQKMDIISVPRDTYYQRPDYNYGGYLKINSVLETDGIKGAAKAVHNVLEGVQINYYAIMNYEGVKKVVDSIGGVPMDVPMDMHYTDKKQNLYIDLKKGKQTLDGAHAIQFLRFRKGYAEGDIGRVKAQQQFVKNAVKEAMGLNLPKVAKTVMDNMDSDLDLRAITYLASKAIGMGGDDLTLHTLPGDDGQRIQGLSFWVAADSEEVLEMMREVYTGIPQTTEGAISSEDTSTSSIDSAE